MLALMRRPTAIRPRCSCSSTQSAASAAELCISYDARRRATLVCNAHAGRRARWPSATSTGPCAGVPPDEIVDRRGRRQARRLRLLAAAAWSSPRARAPCRAASSRRRSATSTATADIDVLVGQYVNSLNDRVASIHYFKWGRRQLDHDRDARCRRSRGSTPWRSPTSTATAATTSSRAGGYGRGMVHLADGAGGFDGGQDLAADRLPEPGQIHARDDGRGRPDRRRPAGARDHRLRRQTP